MKSLLLVAVLAAGALCSSCNTMIGVGRDLRIGGEQLETASDKARGGQGSAGGGSSGAPVY